MQLSFDDLHALVARILVHAGMSDANARIVAYVVVSAERDGAHSHGLFRLPGYLSTLRSGWVDGRATPVVKEIAPSMLHVDASNGYAQVALDAARAPLIAMARRQGGAVRRSRLRGADSGQRAQPCGRVRRPEEDVGHQSHGLRLSARRWPAVGLGSGQQRDVAG